VTVEDGRQPGADVVERLVPADRLERAVSAASQRFEHPVRIVLDIGEGNVFGARAAQAQWVVVVGTQRDHAAVVDCGDESAHRLADPAVGHAVLGRRCGHGEQFMRTVSLKSENGVSVIRLTIPPVFVTLDP
jgi:hypothetical protein